MNDDMPFQFFLAKLFGEKVVSSEDGCTCTGFSWRGKLYVIGFTCDPIPPRTS